jgi:hypothetical protein
MHQRSSNLSNCVIPVHELKKCVISVPKHFPGLPPGPIGSRPMTHDDVASLCGTRLHQAVLTRYLRGAGRRGRTPPRSDRRGRAPMWGSSACEGLRGRAPPWPIAGAGELHSWRL